MASETNDLGAHLTSLPLEPNSVSMLNGQRYDNVNRWSANQWYRIPEKEWDKVKDNATNNGNGFIPVLKWYLRNHFRTQLPRILSLQREYLADNPIHYWKSNKFKRADNRIASAFAQHVTDFKTGLLFGKLIKYGYANPDDDNDTGETLLQTIKDFNSTNDIGHHDKMLGRDALVTGRGYELTYVQANTNIPKVVRLNPNQCFILWNTDVQPKELCAVRYYVVRFGNRSWYEIEVYSNNGFIYHFKTNSTGGDWQPDGNTVANVYGDVPITEYRINDTRQGCFENSLDYFDAYDKAVSAMANSQEDFNNMTLVVSGKVHRPKKIVQARDNLGNLLYYKPNRPHTIYNVTMKRVDKNGNHNDPALTRKVIDTHANAIFLEPYVNSQGQVVSQPKAEYLTKSLDANEWQVYVNELVTRIQQFTGVPNLNNDSTGNQTQLETASRLMDALNEAANAESNFKHGITRRLRLLFNYWVKVGTLPVNDTSDPSNVTVHFDLNLPLNVQETIQKIQALNGTNKVSTKTIQELAASIDNVPQSEEATRLDSEQSSQASNNANLLNNNFKQEVNASNASNNASNDSDESDGSSLASGDNSSAADSDTSSENSDDDNADDSSSSAGNDNNPKASSANATGSTYTTESGSPASYDPGSVDNMALAETIMSSLYADSGYPSGFDSAMSKAVSIAASNSVSAAAAQSATTGDIE